MFSLLAVPASYNKLLVPPALEGKDKLEITFSVMLLKILEIDVVEGIFRIRFIIERTWLDPQLSYQNLNADSRLNQITRDEADSTWFPNVDFLNMPSGTDWSEMIWSRQYNLERNAENQFDQIEATSLDNAFVYSGRKNRHFSSKDFTSIWRCNFDLKWYPFDTQECKMQFRPLKREIYFATFLRRNLTYVGPKDLTEYMVKNYIMCDVQLGRYEGIEVRIRLGRPLLSNILIVFIPCIILLLICHLVNVFDINYLDMVIGVNLTTLLVLATL